MSDCARNAIERLLEKRGPEKTICPSEAARLLAASSDDWRDQMQNIHRAVDEQLAKGLIELSWKGEKLARRRGAYRIARRRSGNS